jgi:hypothetical protein
MALYKPPTQVTTKQSPLLALVTEVDPGWAKGKFWDVDYLTTKRAFFSNPYQRGAYNRLSNVYPVGQQYGGPDTLVTGALAPTVGNPVPGLYQGVPDGKGWA